MSFCIARAVKLSRTPAVFLMEKCHRMLSTRRLWLASHGFAVVFTESGFRFLSRHRNAFRFHWAIIPATELWTSDVLSS